VTSGSTLLWVGSTAAPENVRKATAGHWDLHVHDPHQPLEPQLNQAALAIFQPDGTAQDPRLLARLADALDRSSAVGLFLLPAGARAAWSVLRRRRGPFVCLRDDATSAELTAALQVASGLQPALSDLQHELSQARQRHGAAKPTLVEVDEQMRLASRLQRDFLPRRLPEVGPVRFGALFRPADWVSGDIYDVARLDETHVGFYVADAVGHGLPAALLTMFIKRALQTKRIVGNHYELLRPDESLTLLNQDMCEQNLSSCQFCTAVYGLLDCATMNLTYARAGHPEPILLRTDGTHRKLDGRGGLLGIVEEEQYELGQVTLAPGDRLVVYSDGAMEALTRWPDGVVKDLAAVLGRWRGLPRDRTLLELAERIDQAPVEACGEDDATVLLVDVEG